MKQLVLLTEPIHPDGVALLEKEGLVIRIAKGTAEDILCEEVRAADALIVRLARITQSVLEAGKKLRLVVRHGVGLDNIDLKAATKLGIMVANVPDANTLSVAEHVLGSILALAKRFLIYDRAVREGNFQARSTIPSIDVATRTLGIVGFGRIGREVAKKCMGTLGMQVIAWDPNVSREDIEALGVRYVNSLESLLSQADFVTLHAPSTPETRGMMGAKQFSLMKKGSFFINAARGELVDEIALAGAIRSGHLAGAAVDVFAQEPPAADHPLLGLDNVLLTPHAAGASSDALRRLSLGAATTVVAGLRGEKLTNMVNPEVLRQRR
ncbi:MAG TPA: hydroxyacid dehydrogenase [Firmicutes bacterium]|nr:hydroxyacid dehydrogenase [Bacillota bacterium]